MTICMMAWQPVVAAQDVLDDELPDGTLLVYLQDEAGVLLSGGCFSVIDAEGGVHELCDTAGAGMVTFEGLPYGPVTISATSVPAGYLPAEAQSALIVQDSLASASLMASAIPETPVPTTEPTVEPTIEPTV